MMVPAPAVILRHIRALAGASTAFERTDRELLQYFAAGRDEVAFSALVRRHGPLVFSVCRHVLRHEQDAEDAFQATFLILARKALSIHKKEAVGGWLHGVAYRTAMSARRAMTRRRKRDQRAEGRMPEGPVAEASLHELQALLDAEVERLPNNYRAPFVLCCLEGRSKAEAARELGWKEGTVSSRLAKARERLRQRLVRHGVTLSAALTAVALAGDATAAVPATLMAATVRSVLTAGVLPANAAAWAEGVLSTMSTVSWRAGAALVLTLSILAAGAFGYRQWASGEPQEEQAKAVDAKPAAEGRQPKTDRYGDPLPAGALARLGTVRFLHGGVVRSVAFSKDQKTVASAGDDKMVRLWDLTTGKEIRRFVGHDKWVYTVAFSPDGKILASAGDDQTIRLWEIATGKEIRKLLGHEKEVNSIAFSPDGKVLASGSSDKTIRLWDVGTGKQERQCEGKIGWVGSVVFFPDGKTLVSGSYEDGIHLWDVSSGKELSKPWLPRTGVLGTALSADGKILATNGKDDLGTSLWEIATGTMLRKLQTDRRESEHAVFSPDGTTLATGGMNGPVRTWEVASGKELSRSEGFERGATAMASSPDGKILVTGSLDQRVRLWQTSTGKQIYPFEGHTTGLRSVDYGSDSKTLISTGYDGTARVWDVANAKEKRRFSPYRSNLHVPLAISPNRQTLVSTDLDQKIRFWDLASGKERQRVDRYSGSSIAFFVSPDGNVLAADLKDQVIRLYDVRTGKEIRAFAGKQEHPHPVAFSPDGKWLAAVCFSKADRERESKLKIWSVETGAELPQFQGQRVPLGSTLAFSPDSKMVAGETDEGIYLWEIATGKKRIKLEQGRAYSLAFSADGRTIASGHWDGMVCLWEVASGKRICCFDGHLARVFSVAFSPDGRTLSSGSEDATVLIWDLAGRLKQSKAGRVKLLPRELESLWNDLADRDAAGAYQSVWSLVDAAHESVPFLDTRLRRVLSKDADRQKRVAQMIAALDSDEFAEREKAMTELEALGDLAEPALRQALEEKASLEVSRRVERLLETLGGPVTSPETLQVVRAVEVLERIGTPDARQLLETLAKVASQGRLVQEAKAALERLNRRSAEK